MQTSKCIRTHMIVAGLVTGFTQQMTGATEQRADQDEGGRQVTLEPISQIGVGVTE